MPIRVRLTIAFAAAMFLIVLLAGIFVYLRVSADLNDIIDDALQARADDLSTLVQSSDSGPPPLTAGELAGGASSIEEGFFQILTAAGKPISTTLQASAGAALTHQQVRAALRRPTIFHGTVRGIEGEARSLGEIAHDARGRTYIVVAGASTDDRHEALENLSRTFLAGAPLALLLASGLGYLLAGRALAPVRAMRGRAERITLERSGDRLPLPAAEDELRELGQTLNTMLDRIEAGLTRERVFVADASHELRTPLAILKAELELADRPERSGADVRDALRSARAEVDRLAQLAADLLVIARSDQGQLQIAPESVSLAEVLERVAGRFRRRAEASGREIVVEGAPDVAADLDRFRIEQALGNLVENALRHGEGEIRLSARHDGSRVVLEVADRGPGFAAGFAEQAFERFSRGDAGRSGEGAGLGLAIVRAIAVAHGGEAMAMSADGVTVLRISLPAGGVRAASGP
ncbi:MAG: hypothetical protein QOJ38_1661 [Solirubrobacterales bacterium]|jgi:heavy metal sensor kinase|nr:hypothetical protein [Solirubrobacterales bacterium]